MAIYRSECVFYIAVLTKRPDSTPYFVLGIYIALSVINSMFRSFTALMSTVLKAYTKGKKENFILS